MLDAMVIETEQGTYVPWTDGYAVGYRLVQDGRDDAFIYLNPSDGSDDGQPNVFVYSGAAGDPSLDVPLHHYDVGELVEG